VRVLGLDPGSRRTGYGVVEGAGNRLACITHGHVSPPARLDLAMRLHTIAARAGELMDEHAPDCVVVEEAFYHESVRSTLVLGHVRGALLVAAASRGIAVAEYSPREVKLSVTGNGGATKEQVGYMVARLLDLHGGLQPDAADALASAVCHLHRARRAVSPRAVSAAARNLEALLARRGSR
jgi:crossover junction endodeoxyribonuclease RuvC